MQNNDVDIAIITKSWLSSAGAQLLANISGYTAYHRTRSHRKGAGVALYVKNSILVQQVNVKVPKGLECTWLLVTPSYLPREISSLLIAAVYHPPKAPTGSKLIDHIAHTVASFKSSHPYCGIPICGDFSRVSITSLCSKGMKQIVLTPIWGSALLDLILTDISRFYKNAVILPPIRKSDHDSVLWRPEAGYKTKSTTETVISRSMPDSAVRRFGQWITAYDWRPVLEASGAQAKATVFYSIMGDQITHHFPIRVNKRRNNDKAWMSNKIRSLIRRRQWAFGMERKLCGNDFGILSTDPSAMLS